MYKTLVQKKTMEYGKVFIMIANAIGVPLTLLGIIVNLDNIKGLILFLLVAVFWGVKIYYSIKKNDQSLREKEYELWNREMDKQERQLQLDKARNKVNGR